MSGQVDKDGAKDSPAGSSDGSNKRAAKTADRGSSDPLTKDDDATESRDGSTADKSSGDSVATQGASAAKPSEPRTKGARPTIAVEGVALEDDSDGGDGEGDESNADAPTSAAEPQAATATASAATTTGTSTLAIAAGTVVSSTVQLESPAAADADSSMDAEIKQEDPSVGESKKTLEDISVKLETSEDASKAPGERPSEEQGSTGAAAVAKNVPNTRVKAEQPTAGAAAPAAALAVVANSAATTDSNNASDAAASSSSAAAAAADSSGSAAVAGKAGEAKNQEGNKAKPRQRLTTEQQRKILRKVHAKWKLHRGRQFVTTWHKSEADLPMRREMIKHIVKLLRLRRTDASPEWLKKLPEMARRLEDNLYRNAESNEAYRDTKTLKLRLQEVAKQMGERKKRQQDIIKRAEAGDLEAQAWLRLEKEYMYQKKKKMDYQRQQRMQMRQKAASAGASSREAKKNSAAAAGSSSTQAARSKSSSIVTQGSRQHQKQVLRQKQQRLLLLRHASRCPAGTPHGPEVCTATRLCKEMKLLWAHIANCKDPRCSRAHCVSSRFVLAHYHSCKDINCPVCAPVREAIHKHSQSRQGSRMRTSGGASKSSKADSKVSLTSKQKRRQLPKKSQSLLNAYTNRQIKEHLQSLRDDFSSAFTPLQLTKRLQPLVEKMWNHGQPDENYSSVFHEKVDPLKMHLPDYFDIVKNPMDLKTIREKLEKGNYQTPNMFAKHMRLVFTNAMRYNAKGEWVYNAAEKMLKDFDKGFNSVMKKMQKEAGERKGDNVCAACHGEQFQLQPPTLMCNGTCKNKIRKKATYYTLPGNMKFHWCQQCYTSMGREPFMLEGQQIVKSELKKKKNDKETTEAWVQCDECKRWVHQICALFNVKKNGASKDELFFCPECILESRDSGDSRPSEQLENTAEKLPSCEMSDYMERFCRNVLIKARQDMANASGKSLKDCPDLSKDITVRVIMSKREKLDIRDGFYRRYKGIGYPEEVDYVSKAILMFYKVDNIDVLIFGMYVQEFDESAHEPSKRSVYISYLDSVRMIEPTSWRTKLYKEFIISYLSYSRERGFTNAFIWSCPPGKGDDYIFHCKPEDQKTPKTERLRMWYQDLLQKGVKDGLIYRVTTMWENFFAPKIDPLERMVREREERESSLFGAEDGFQAEERDDAIASAGGAGGDASKAKQRSRAKRKISMNAKVKTKAKKKKPTSNAQKVRENIVAYRLPYYSGDYWPGLAEESIQHFSEKEAKEHKEAAEKLQLEQGSRRKRRKPGEEEKKQDPNAKDSPFCIYTPGEKDKVAYKMADVLNQMKRDFFVVQLVPQCWNCDKYITTQERYACMDSRQEGDMSYILCPTCWETIPDESKEVARVTTLTNSVGLKAAPHTLLSNQLASRQSKRRSALLATQGASQGAASGGDGAAKKSAKEKAKAAGAGAGAATDDAKKKAGGDTGLDDQKTSPETDVEMAPASQESQASQETQETQETQSVESGGAGKKRKREQEPKLSDEEKLRNACDVMRPVPVLPKLKRKFIKEISPEPLGDKVNDPDGDGNPGECEIMSTRNMFLSLCQGNNYQFDQKRRAKHSSMMVLYHLHNPDMPAFVHTCNVCQTDIQDIVWRCQTCQDFDMCNSCYKKGEKEPKLKHPHEMKRQDLGTPSSTSSNRSRQKKQHIELHMKLLVHASGCRDKDCPSTNCAKMKALLKHGATCKVRATGGCSICRRIWALLQIHARNCRIKHRCPVPRCADLKDHLRRMRKRQRQEEDARRQQYQNSVLTQR